MNNHTNVRLVKTRISLPPDNKIHFSDGPLVAHNDVMKKDDRHKSFVMISTEFLESERDVWLGVNVISPQRYSPGQSSS